MGNNLFKRGYAESRKELKRQEEARARRKNGLFRFFLKDDGSEAVVRFLTEEPINFFEHNVKHGDKYDTIPCVGEDCPYCANGDNPQYKGAFLIYDRTSYKNKEGKKVDGSLRLYVGGARVITQLDRLHTKYGLTNRDITITRVGKGTSTTYAFDRGDLDKLTTKEIEQMLPENLRKEYDGTADSLYEIVVKALQSNIPVDSNSVTNSDNDDDDYDEEVYEADSRFIDDEDDEEEPKPKTIKKSTGIRKSAITKKTSARSFLKSKR